MNFSLAPFIARCEAIRRSDQQRCDLLTAVLAEECLGLDETLAKAFAEDGYNFIHTHQYIPVNQYIEEHPQYAAEVSGLCQQLRSLAKITFTFSGL